MRTACLAVLLCAALAAPAAAQQVVVTVADATPLQTLDALYQGYNIDSGSLYNGIQLGNAVLVQLTRNLAPAQLRIGGSASDSVWYCPDAPDGATRGPTPDPLAPNYAALAAPGYSGYVPEVTVINDNLWRSITGFAAASGTSLLWNLNAVDFRTPSGAWDPALNASALLAFTAAQGLSVASWELGNEPDIWTKHFGLTVSGTQLADDLRTLQASLEAAGLSTALAGPSLATYNAPIVQSFLQGWQASGGGALSFTTHAYPLGPPTYAPNSTRPSCSIANYLNLTRVNNIASYLGEFTSAVQQFGDSSSTRLILEETASNSLGGCVGYSDRFISGFYWLNILGLVAESNFQQINRQDLAGMSFTASGSQYTLFGPPGWVNGSGLVDGTSPHPDYYTSLLFRRLMGLQVLSSTVTPSAAGSFAAHVWCAASTAPGAGPGAVTLAFINAMDTPSAVQVVGAGGAAYALSPRSEFILTGDSLTDSVIYLNAPAGSKVERAAARLRVNKDGSLPDVLAMPTGRPVADGATQLLVPPLSYGFFVLPAANAPACSAVVASASAAPPAPPVGVKAAPPPVVQKHELVRVVAGVAVAAVVAGIVLVWVRMQGIYARPYDDRRKLLAQSSESPHYGGV